MARGVKGMWPGGGLAAVPDDLFDLGPDRFEGDAERLECLRRDAFALVDEAEEDVLGADVVVVEQTRFFLRQHHHSAGSVSEAFEHWCVPCLL